MLTRFTLLLFTVLLTGLILTAPATAAESPSETLAPKAALSTFTKLALFE